MKKILLLGLIIITHLGAQQAPDAQDPFATLVRSQNTFALDLFKEISPEVKQNMCLSPYSVTAALSMPLSGAQGSTQTQMLQAMRVTLAPDKVDEAFFKLNQQLFSRASETSSELRLIQANSLWIQSGMPIKPEFDAAMDKYYRGFFRRENFSSQVETSRSNINNWVREKTLGKISQLFDKGDITSQTRMALVNTLYMKARWARPFNEQLTHQEPFFGDDKSTLSVLMMVDIGEYPYFQSPSFAMVKIPYVTQRTQNEQLAMLIVLPHTRGQLGNVIKEINPNVFQTWLLSMKPERIQLMLPKFKISSAFDLNGVLTKMGMSDAFTDRADFSGITTVPLKISVVRQKTVIEVDEAGTEAVASTGVSMAIRSAMNEGTPINFTADHPFAYIIYDQGTGVILFMGKVMNPNSQD
jgi:serpin B